MADRRKLSASLNFADRAAAERELRTIAQLPRGRNLLPGRPGLAGLCHCGLGNVPVVAKSCSRPLAFGLRLAVDIEPKYPRGKPVGF